MCTPIFFLIAFIRSWFQSRLRLQVEIVALRHQVIVLRRSQKGRVHPRAADRLFWVWLTGLWSGWRSALAIVASQPRVIELTPFGGMSPFTRRILPLLHEHRCSRGTIRDPDQHGSGAPSKYNPAPAWSSFSKTQPDHRAFARFHLAGHVRHTVDTKF